MRSKTRFLILSIAIALICLGTIVTACSQASASGQVEVVKSFEAADLELPEGIAIDKTGNMYVSLGLPGFAGGTSGEIWKISPDGTETVLVEFDVPPAAGLAVDATGNVYYAHPTNDSTTGVYRLSSDGGTERLPGTENMFLPNGLAFDEQGNLYASDSIQGAIWRIPGGGAADAESWSQHELLAGCPPDLPFGANGVAYWKGNLYVANTAKGLLVRIPILTDGSAGNPELIAGDPNCGPDELFGMTGLPWMWTATSTPCWSYRTSWYGLTRLMAPLPSCLTARMMAFLIRHRLRYREGRPKEHIYHQLRSL